MILPARNLHFGWGTSLEQRHLEEAAEGGKSLVRDLFDAGEDWLDDGDAAPGIID